ncbi:hypothetical protein TcCL_ESM11908 [Trypanosoma cruzi]|nr:hypothetical protein TcCL_ESM11908 [Trypanosoma cruzi]
MDKDEEKRHTAAASRPIPQPAGRGHSHAANTQRTPNERPHHQPHAEVAPHPAMAWHEKIHCHPALSAMRRLTPCGHTECTASPIEIIRHPCLEDASVNNGP